MAIWRLNHFPPARWQPGEATHSESPAGTLVMTISQLEKLARISGENGEYTEVLPALPGVEANRDNRKIWKVEWREGNLARKSKGLDRSKSYEDAPAPRGKVAYRDSEEAMEMALLHGPEEVWG